MQLLLKKKAFQAVTIKHDHFKSNNIQCSVILFSTTVLSQFMVSPCSMCLFSPLFFFFPPQVLPFISTPVLTLHSSALSLLCFSVTCLTCIRTPVSLSATNSLSSSQFLCSILPSLFTDSPSHLQLVLLNQPQFISSLHAFIFWEFVLSSCCLCLVGLLYYKNCSPNMAPIHPY